MAKGSMPALLYTCPGYVLDKCCMCYMPCYLPCCMLCYRPCYVLHVLYALYAVL